MRRTRRKIHEKIHEHRHASLCLCLHYAFALLCADILQPHIETSTIQVSQRSKNLVRCATLAAKMIKKTWPNLKWAYEIFDLSTDLSSFLADFVRFRSWICYQNPSEIQPDLMRPILWDYGTITEGENIKFIRPAIGITIANSASTHWKVNQLVRTNFGHTAIAPSSVDCGA